MYFCFIFYYNVSALMLAADSEHDLHNGGHFHILNHCPCLTAVHVERLEVRIQRIFNFVIFDAKIVLSSAFRKDCSVPMWEIT